MHSTVQDIFFSVIRSSIWNSPLDVNVPDGYDWIPVLQMFQDQALIGLVASTIMQLPEAKRPQTLELQDFIVSSYALHVQTRVKIQRTIVRVFNELERHGIKPILMKGESMVRFYPQDCQRGIGDIDILVPQDRYRESVRILQTLSEDMGHEDPMERHYKIQYNGFDLEIHQRPVWCANSMHKKDYQRITQKYVDPDKCEMIQLQGKDIRVFPMQYNVLFIFNHLLEHLRDGGVGFKQIIDWVMMLDRVEVRNEKCGMRNGAGASNAGLAGDVSAPLNMTVLEEELRMSGLLRAWKVMGGIAVKNLGLSQEKFPFYDEKLAKKSQGEILQRIIQGGNFGWMLHQQEEKKQITPLRVLNNMLYVIKDTRYLWTLFPSGALASSWGIIKGSLLNHAGITKGNTVFEK